MRSHIVNTIAAASVLVVAAGCGWIDTDDDDGVLPAGTARQPAPPGQAPTGESVRGDDPGNDPPGQPTPSPFPSPLQPTATPQTEGEPYTPDELDPDADPDDTVDTDELEDTNDAEHLAMFPTTEPTPTPDPDVTDMHEHARDLPWAQVEIADPDDPYPIQPPDPDEVDLTDAQQVAEAFACNWWVTPEDTGADYRNDTIGHLVAGQLADDLAMMSGAGTQEGEWFEAELLHSELTDLQPVDDGQRFWVVCHTRAFVNDEFTTVVYDRPMFVQTVPAENADGEWQVESFDVGDYVEWHPDETPPDL